MTRIPQWLRVFHQTLVGARVPVAELVVAAGSVEIALGRPTWLRVSVTPVGKNSRGYCRTRRHVIGYSGARDLDARGRYCLDRIAVAVRRIEPHLPERFDEPFGIFGPDTLAEERFSRLFPFCRLERSHADGQESVEILLRATDRCNQACPFCSAPELENEPGRRTVARCIEEGARLLPNAILTLTGGEPTLRASFQDEVLRAARGFRRVQVQTNAVAFAARLRAADFPVSDRLHFFVSLHALEADIYDTMTGTSGQLEKALEGLRALHAGGHNIVVNCVVAATNLAHLPAYVTKLPETVSCDERVELHFSVLICPEYRPDAPRFLVPYRELVPALEAAAALAVERGVRVSPLRSSTHAAMPACTLTHEADVRAQRRPVVLEHETGFEHESKPWVKAPVCRECSEFRTCLGVPRPYADRFGLEELTPFRGG